LAWLFGIVVFRENWEQVSAEAGSDAGRKYRVFNNKERRVLLFGMR